MVSHSDFIGSIPELYDRYLVPVVLAPFADDLARRVAASRPMRVLELACGTGLLTSRLRSALSTDATIVATDLQQPMLDVARRKHNDFTGVEWQQADAMDLPFGSDRFEAVACQFGVMFFPDKLRAAQEAARVLEPGGTFVFNVWDGLERNQFARLVHETVGSFFQQAPPDFCLTPFGYHDPAAIGAMLSLAGFSRIEILPLSLEGIGPSAHELARGIVEGNPLSLSIRERGVEVDRVVEAVGHAIARECGDRPVRLHLNALIVSGVRTRGHR
ncbi:MAG: methyltransferase domain-containing protein [Gemmatimonadota bacterium]